MSSRESLSAVLFANSPPRLAQKAQTHPWLEATLGEMLDAARNAWPDVDLDPALYLAHVASHLDPDCRVEDIHAADLYLAAACLAGDQHAISEFDRVLGTVAPRLRANVGDPRPDEARQTVRIKLLVGTSGKPPRLATYAGRGPLAGWLHVVMARQLLDMQRAKPKELPSETVAALAEENAVSVDPEVAYLRKRYRDDFKRAFAEALDQLPDRERGVLRLHVVGRMSIDRIAACCGIGRSTAARWLANIRDQILETTRLSLARRLTIPQADAKSIIRALRSDFDVSVVRLLAEKPEDPT
ncbi:sigma-70 family RNA polymerase sigma factor [Myxococcota bacterium]